MDIETSGLSGQIKEIHARMAALDQFAEALSRNLSVAARSFDNANYARTLQYVNKMRRELSVLEQTLMKAEKFASTCQSLASSYCTMKFGV